MVLVEMESTHTPPPSGHGEITDRGVLFFLFLYGIVSKVGS